MAGHTPGPWRVLFPGIYHVENPYPIAKVHRTDRSGPEIDANARLIAEAPETAEQRDELLATLELVSELMSTEEYNDSLNIIDAAIAKAKGH